MGVLLGINLLNLLHFPAWKIDFFLNLDFQSQFESEGLWERSFTSVMLLMLGNPQNTGNISSQFAYVRAPDDLSIKGTWGQILKSMLIS